MAKKIVHIIVEGDFKELLDYDIHAAELYTHTLKVTYMCILLGQKQNMNLEQLYDLAEGALFHDIGIRFISVPYKNFDIDKMKPEQLFEMKRHTILGYSVLDEFDWISQTAKDMVLSHHEKLDGTGYPLKQRNTQKACKIIQICDTIDGMYCGIETKRYTMEKIYHYFQENGQCYEQEMVEQIFSIIARYPAGTVVKLNNDRKAVVVQQTRYADRPVIKLIEPVFGKTGEEINMIVKNDIEIIGVCE